MNLLKNFISQYDRTTWIPIDKCRDGFVYHIHARNAYVGIYDEKEKGFIICRHKFNDIFLFTEYHWDTGEPYGTVKPLHEIEKAPTFKNGTEKLNWLDEKNKTVTSPWEIL